MNAQTGSTVTLERPAGADAEQPGGSRQQPRRWQCVCSQLYRVTGRDRHRVSWPLDAPPAAPVMDGCCVRCRRPLPGKYAHCAERS